ncbi:hypothetical protein N566_04860, partial [Streptomycetaceae bacterium MP113-05]
MQLIVRALSVLRTVAAADDGHSQRELAALTGIPVGSVHRLLSVLEEQRFLSRSPTNKRYFLGPTATRFAEVHNWWGATTLVQPHPAVGELVARAGEAAAFLTELSGERLVCTALSERIRPRRLFAEVGQEMPLHASAAARVFLAFQPETVVAAMLRGCPFTSYTRRTPAGASELLAR